MKHKMRAEANKNVGEGILQMAADEAADFMVCGSKGSGGGKNVKRGSVAEFLSRNSNLPIVIVPSRFA